MSFSDINCEDFEEKAKNEDKNDIFHNFQHAHRDPEGFLSHICQDGSLCDSPFKSIIIFYQVSSRGYFPPSLLIIARMGTCKWHGETSMFVSCMA